WKMENGKLKGLCKITHHNYPFYIIHLIKKRIRELTGTAPKSPNFGVPQKIEFTKFLGVKERGLLTTHHLLRK
ncbi:MAG: hypothetical protein KBT47_06355, partial [Armatimonadetes bacterium]|nr:hypothetical protein [Candidatus Hippobium faecium]